MWKCESADLTRDDLTDDDLTRDDLTDDDLNRDDLRLFGGIKTCFAFKQRDSLAQK